MQTAQALLTVAVLLATLHRPQVVAQTSAGREDTPRRVLVLAHADPASQELAAAVRRQLAAHRRYEIVAERALTPAERPVDVSADSVLTQKRALALAVRAEAFIDIDATRIADSADSAGISRVTAIRSISDSKIVDVFNFTPRGSVATVARAVVDRLVPNGWPARTR
jgi:hypothetical protein